MKAKTLAAVFGCVVSFTATADGLPGMRGSDPLQLFKDSS